jgi:hypothetical protein
MSRHFSDVTWNKPAINDALQAIEDTFQTTGKTALNNAIEGAAPGVFNAQQKKLLVAYFILTAAFREGAL